MVNVSIWGHPATVDMQKLVLKEIDLRGTIAYAGDHPAVIKLVQEGKVDLSPLSPAGSPWMTSWTRASTPSSTTTTRGEDHRPPVVIRVSAGIVADAAQLLPGEPNPW